jgi:two-component system osmolarity sensor histidine kinase EnvZ
MFSGLAADAAQHATQSAAHVVRPPKIVPRTMYARSLAIVVLPLLILQAVLAYIFYERHWDSVTGWLAVGFSGEIGMVVDLFDQAESRKDRKDVLKMARDHFHIAISFEPGGGLEPAAEASGFRAPGDIDERLVETFESALDRPFVIDTRLVDKPRRIAVYVQMDDGLLRILAPRKRVDSTTTRVFIGWMVGLSVLLLSLAIYFMGRQVRPIRRLAWAADNFGKGRDVGDFKLAGPTEIRQAGAAFNLMRKRILRHLSQRTEMLAAVSHDLRTPLTRMKLELEMLAGGKAQQGDLDDLRSDVEEMAKIVEGYLAFARGEGQEAIEIADMGVLLQEVAERARTEGKEVVTLLEKSVKLPLRPIAIRRCVTNLVQNAARHAHRIEIRATTHGDQAWIAIDDDGPGIPAEQRDAVFKPFFRLDRSRNPTTGGVGLGLTIARDIVLSHGGDIELGESPAGGLRVLIRLPR